MTPEQRAAWNDADSGPVPIPLNEREVWVRRLGEGDSLVIRVMREGEWGEEGIHTAIDVPFATLTKYIRNDPELRERFLAVLK